MLYVLYVIINSVNIINNSSHLLILFNIIIVIK